MSIGTRGFAEILESMEEAKKAENAKNLKVRTQESCLDWLENTPLKEISDTPQISYYKKIGIDHVQLDSITDSFSVDRYEKHKMSPFFCALVHKKYDLCRKLLKIGKLGSLVYERTDILEDGSEVQSELSTPIYRYFLIDESIPKDIRTLFWDIQIEEMKTHKSHIVICNCITPLEYAPDTRLLYGFCEGVDVSDYKRFYDMHLRLLRELLEDRDDIDELFLDRQMKIYQYGTSLCYDRFDNALSYPNGFAAFMQNSITDIQMEMIDILFSYYKKTGKPLQKLLNTMPIASLESGRPYTDSKEKYFASLLGQIKKLAKAYEVDKVRKRHFFNYVFELAVYVKGDVSQTLYQEYIKLAKRFYMTDFASEDILLCRRDDFCYTFPLCTAIRVLEDISKQKISLHLKKKKHFKWFADVVKTLSWGCWNGYEQQYGVNTERINSLKMWLGELEKMTFESTDTCPYDWQIILNTKNNELLSIMLQKGVYPVEQIATSIAYCMECKLNQLVPLLLLYQVKESKV